MIRQEKTDLAWQSKAILLLVVPWASIDVFFKSLFWAQNAPVVAWTTLGISAAFGLIVWRMKAGTPTAAATGAVITASLMYNTAKYPYNTSWLHGGLLPLLAVFLLTYAATKIGKSRKEKLGTGESKRGRNAAQVAANLGAAALFASAPISLFSPEHFLRLSLEAIATFAALTVLSEATADTISSEIGQVFGGEPRLITTLRRVPKGTDGGITVIGTFAGAIAALIVMSVGFWAMRGTDKFLGYWVSICLGTACGIFGLLFDSLLGATLERKGWLNNDAVNFLSTLSAVIFPAVLAGGIAAEIMRRHPAW